ncbi:rhomboid family intramembrane serine protease [Ornithinicoccus halotolerans]|uniref:rhomboid family intramembrane serine protease n=1 Tax=Ornithinicoccus halotolerans TaxID=1748220 RepID=UPI001296650B|nr:rhomboid family intramembrane serine protease [Ornithinicoccus halotolerans]
MTHPAAEQGPPVCPRHPDRVAYVRCQRCGRPACPDCQRAAAVGVQCRDCVAEGARQVRRPTTRYGADAAGGRPTVTLVIVGLCVLVYVAQLAQPEVTRQLMFLPAAAEEQPWRFLTAAFAHSPSTVMHILFNMYALWITGSYLEPLLGRVRFLALYLISALGGSSGYLLLARLPEGRGDFSGWVTPTVGASGAVFGLFAAVLVLNRHLGRRTAGILVILVANTVIGFVVPGIAWQAHLGGAVTGGLLAAALVVTSSSGRDPAAVARRRWQWPALLAVLALVVAAAVLRLATVDEQAVLRMLYGG